MRYQGFCGASDVAMSIAVNDERTINFYVEGQKRTAKAGGSPALYATPGLRVFAQGVGSAWRATFEEDGRAFGVCGTHFYEVAADGSLIDWGTVAADSNPATIDSNGRYGGHQLFIVSGGNGYIFDLTANTLTLIADPDFPNGTALMGAFLDQFFIVLKTDGSFLICAAADGTNWDALDITRASQSSDTTVSLLVDHREIWLFGPKTTGVWFNSGNADFPFEPVQGVFIQKGIRAPWSAKRIDNSLMWLGHSEDGSLACYRAQQFTPVRVSTPAIEYAWSQLAKADLDAAIAWVYEENGHAFYHVYVPNDETQKVYDVAENVWTERAHWDAPNMAWVPHVGRAHMYAHGKHLIGDRQSGALYHQSLDYVDEQLAGL